MWWLVRRQKYTMWRPNLLLDLRQRSHLISLVLSFPLWHLEVGTAICAHFEEEKGGTE